MATGIAPGRRPRRHHTPVPGRDRRPPHGLRGLHRAGPVPAGDQLLPGDVLAVDLLAAGLADRVGNEFVVPVTDPAGRRGDDPAVAPADELAGDGPQIAPRLRQVVAAV